ncbi:hypothetical protein DXG01_011813 [Tephrocybe rancida]|nr:hypothetical protein DXG01_011813 [Tephrocybe rancida]
MECHQSTTLSVTAPFPQSSIATSLKPPRLRNDLIYMEEDREFNERTNAECWEELDQLVADDMVYVVSYRLARGIKDREDADGAVAAKKEGGGEGEDITFAFNIKEEEEEIVLEFDD